MQRDRELARRARARPRIECGQRLVEQQDAGCGASARASATRWRSPPESACGRASARSARPNRSSSSSASRAARCVRWRPQPVRDVAPSAQVGEQRVVLEHVAAAPAFRRPVQTRAAVSTQTSSPYAIRPRSGRTVPAKAAGPSSCPAPEGPASARHWRGATPKRDVAAGCRATAMLEVSVQHG